MSPCICVLCTYCIVADRTYRGGSSSSHLVYLTGARKRRERRQVSHCWQEKHCETDEE